MHGIMDSKINGIINFGTTEQISKYDFLIKIAEVFNFDKELIIENSISNFEALKNRPRNTTLNTGYLDKKLDLSFSIDDGIHLMYQDYKRIFNEQN
jgi:dTDP-4-dehydrorhamnose reductase